ncbi:MAG TPA: DUF3479 domain-containing protein, partial [Pyrinomonadaceae bacterium]
MKITALIVGSSLLGPLRRAEEEINRRHAASLSVRAYNLGAPLEDAAWAAAERDLAGSDIVFVIHVTDGENAARLLPLLEKYEARHRAVVVINCMPELMRLTRMGRLRFARDAAGDGGGEDGGRGRAAGMVRALGGWMGRQVRARRGQKGASHSHTQYTKLVERLPALLRLVPGAG